MINKLISLVLLVFFLTTSHSYSEGQFLFPKKKPSVFKKIEKIPTFEKSNNLPQKKPITQTDPKKIETAKIDKSERKKNEPETKKQNLKKK